jgi:hypothetical protein
MGHDSTKGQNKPNTDHHSSGRSGNVIHDPYIPQAGYPEPTICPVCNASYHHKHWSFDAAQLATAKSDKSVQMHTCPACKKIHDKYAMGKIRLTGAFVTSHIEELSNVIKKEERMAKENNPLDRLMLLDTTDGNIYAETTSDALAMRIGHHLKNAYKCGDEAFKFRTGEKFVEVDWHKE